MRKNPPATPNPMRQMLLTGIHVDRNPRKRQTPHLQHHTHRPAAIPRLGTLRRRHNRTRKRLKTPRHDNRRHAGTAPNRHGPNNRLRHMCHHTSVATVAKILLQALIATSYTSKSCAKDNPTSDSHRNYPPSQASTLQSRNHEKPHAHPSSARFPASA